MSLDVTFPALRFKDAGATDEEVEQLVAEFTNSDPVAQSSLVSTWAGQPVSALALYLKDLRDAEHFAGLPREAASAPVEGSDDEEYGDAPADRQDSAQTIEDGSPAAEG